MNDKYCAFLGHNFDDIEAITIINILRRSDIVLDVYGIDEELIKSFTGVQYKVDQVFKKCSDIDVSEYKGLLLPGGPGVERLLQNNEIIDLVHQFNSENKLVFAICGAPIILDRAGVLENRNYTCLPAVSSLIKSGSRVDDKVVVDGNVITSKALGTSMDAALKLVEIIKSKEKAIETAENYYINLDHHQS
ncbi:DJ-1/PfpI family protein [Paenibacillus durus]|uniref:DJ-1/PfpI family protein n=1 Tax=Paenibacillus durus TaxID=44251 RepID=UPI0005A681A0|nr:DJ-1/PfpI family protein [Paenibacillus durus]